METHYWMVKKDESNPLWEDFKKYWRGIYTEPLKPSMRLTIEEQLEDNNYFSNIEGVWTYSPSPIYGYTEISLEEWKKI